MDLYGRNFLTLKDFSKEEIRYFLDLAHQLKKDKKEGKKKNIILWERAVLFGALIVAGIWKREKVKEIWKNLS